MSLTGFISGVIQKYRNDLAPRRNAATIGHHSFLGKLKSSIYHFTKGTIENSPAIHCRDGWLKSRISVPQERQNIGAGYAVQHIQESSPFDAAFSVVPMKLVSLVWHLTRLRMGFSRKSGSFQPSD
jgi:hypothetical protein